MGGGHQAGNGFRTAVKADGAAVIGTASAGKILRWDALPLQGGHPLTPGLIDSLWLTAFAVKHRTDKVASRHHLAAKGRVDLARLVQTAVQVSRFAADEVKQQFIQQAVAHIFLFAARRLKTDLEHRRSNGIFCSQ